MRQFFTEYTKPHWALSCTLTGERYTRFFAYEQLRSELLERQYALSLKPSLSNTSVDSKGKLIKPIQWTGGIIHLIELAHGIHLREQVNNGSIGIVDFFVSLRDFLESIWVFPKKVLTISKQGSAEEDRIHRPDQVIPFEKMVEEDEIFKKSVKEFENPVQPQYLHDALFLYR